MNDLSYATGLHRKAASVVMTEIVRLAKKPTIPHHTVRLMPGDRPDHGRGTDHCLYSSDPNQRLVREL